MDQESIFVRALGMDSDAERSRFLDQECGGNAALRAEIESLLQAHQGAGSFLEKPPAELAATRHSSEGSTGDSWQEVLKPSQNQQSLGVLGAYEVEELLGRGGMGVVLKARDPRLNRTVAIKLLAPELAANPMAVRRFLREAQAAAAVSHDHVLTIHAIEESSQPPLIVMEYVPGQSLQQKIDREGSMDVKSILRIGLQTAQALAAAHRQGLVHRDVKPSNILLENGVERVKLGDFGLARAVDDVGITRTGQITGTPQYMSPEQAGGETVDHRSDLFSLGAVIYAMCTGRAAFRADSAVAVLHRVIHEHPNRIDSVNPEIPEWLSEIVEVLLEKDPDNRFQTAEDVADLLEAHLAHLQTPEIVPQPARLPVRAESEADDDPKTMLGAFFYGIWYFAIWFVGIFGLAAIYLTLRTRLDIWGRAAILIVAVVVATWISEQWPDWRERWRKHRERKRGIGFRHSHPEKWGFGIAGVVIIGGSAFLLFGVFSGSSQQTATVKRPERKTTVEPKGNQSTDDELIDSAILPARSVELKVAAGTLPKETHSKYLDGLFFSPDRKSLAWISRPKPGRYRTWVFDTASGKERFQIESTEEVAAFSPDGQTFAFCGHETDNNPLRQGGREGVWLADAQTGELRTFLQAELWPSNARSLEFDSQGERLALGHAHNWTTPSGWKGLVSIWNVKSKKQIHVLKDHDFRVSDARFTPDGEHIIVLGENGQLVAWKDDEIVAQNEMNLNYGFPATALSPDGKTYAVSTYSKADKTLRVMFWTWEANEQQYLATAHEKMISSLAFSPDGRVLASGDMGGPVVSATIRLHDLTAGKEIAVLQGHENWVRAVAFEDQNTLISASHDGTIKGWNVDSVVPNGKNSNGDELIDSAILLKEFREFYREHAPKNPSKLESLADPFAVTAGIMQMRMHFPGFLRVTREQEEDFSKGEFDDAGAKRRIEPMLKSLKDFGVQLPVLTEKIVKDYENGRLEGARLELAAHLIQASLAQVKSQIENAAGE